MKSTNKPQSITRVSRFSKISQKHGLIVALLILASFLLQPVNPALSGLVAVASFAALIYSFISGYKRSDELERLVQLKAAAISFIVVMSMTFVILVFGADSSAANKDDIGDSGFIFATGFLLHLFLLPAIAKRTHEK